MPESLLQEQKTDRYIVLIHKDPDFPFIPVWASATHMVAARCRVVWCLSRIHSHIRHFSRANLLHVPQETTEKGKHHSTLGEASGSLISVIYTVCETTKSSSKRSTNLKHSGQTQAPPRKLLIRKLKINKMFFPFWLWKEKHESTKYFVCGYEYL